MSLAQKENNFSIIETYMNSKQFTSYLMIRDWKRFFYAQEDNNNIILIMSFKISACLRQSHHARKTNENNPV